MIYFIRHGESQANVDNVFSGPESQLTENGRRQAAIAGEKLKIDGIVIDHIIASPYDRAAATAKILAKAIGFDPNKIQYDTRLAEYNAGELVGKSEMGVTAKQVVEAKGAEDSYVLKNRIVSSLEDIKLLSGNTLIVSHAGVGRMINIIKLGLDPKSFYTISAYENCQLIVL